jgi:two-component system LytT family response regulator
MSQIKAIIVDDEERARNILKNLIIKYCPEIEVLASFDDVPSAVEGVKKHQPDLVFLDVEMPQYAGYEIVNFFEHVPFDIIFVTAYDHYALKAFEVSAIDYLLKPVEIDRLKDSVQRIIKRKETSNNQAIEHLKKTLSENKFSSILVSKNNFQHRVELVDIIAFEAQESYSIIHTKKEKFLVSKNLKHYETLLKEHSEFFRVHKSWLVNIQCVESYSKSKFEIILSNGLTTKLSKYKKKGFEDSLNNSH